MYRITLTYTMDGLDERFTHSYEGDSLALILRDLLEIVDDPRGQHLTDMTILDTQAQVLQK